MSTEGPPLIPDANCPRDWRFNREVRFTWRQQRLRESISFQEIAEWLLDLDGRDTYGIFQRDLLAGEFEEAGRSKVLYLHQASAMARMTRQRLNDAIVTLPPDIIRSEYLARCWLPRRMFDRWLAKHELPPKPARFEPQDKTPTPPSAITKAVTKREAAEQGVRAVFPGGVPASVSNAILNQRVGVWLKQNYADLGEISDDTIERAAGRKK
jgi:hypothetical protein